MWDQIEANKNKSIALITGMAMFLLVLGYVLGEAVDTGSGITGTLFAFGIWLILTLISYFKGDSIFLSVSKARKIQPDDHQMLYNIVEEMKIASGLPKIPEVYIIDEEAPNAFAIGRSPETASVAVTSGLLKALNRDELQGVIAHEMAHISNRDTLYMTMAGIMMGSIIMLADAARRILFYSGGSRTRSSSRKGGGAAPIIIIAIILIILAPVISRLFYYTISRKREYLADACAAQYTRFPAGLANALQKISGAGIKMKSASKVTAPMYIINPLKNDENSLLGLFSTHPKTSERIKILMSMANSGLESYNQAYENVTGSGKIISGNNLVNAENIPIRQPLVAENLASALPVVGAGVITDETTERVRQTTDLLWKLNDYIFINCDCGTNLKIPSVYANKVINCPHCMTGHAVKAAN